MIKTLRQPIVVLWIILILLMIPPVFAQTIETPSSASDISVTQQYYQWIEMGKAAVPELKTAIRSDDWRMRTHALLAIGQIGDRTLTPLVMDRLNNDPHPAVKNCAVTALGDLKKTAAVPLLIHLLTETAPTDEVKPLPQQRVVIRSLGKIGDSRAITPLLDLLLSEKNEQIRGEIAEALVAINDPAVSQLILKNKPAMASFPYVQAAQISGALPVAGSEDYLIALAGNDHLPVKNAAVIALGQIKSVKSVPILLPLLETGNTQLQTNVSDALIRIDAPRAVIPLCDLLGSPDPNTATIAAYILARMTDNQIPQEVYARFLQNHAINAPAAIVLGQKQYQTALAELRARLSDAEENGQNEMAEALGWINDRESIPLLMNVASRTDKQGAAGAIWSLGHLKAGEAIPLMLGILKKQDQALTGPAVFALGEIGDPAAVKPIIDLYYESGFQYQMQVALALSQIGGPEVAEILKTNMESGHPKRQKMAGYMLLKSRDPSLVSYAITLLSHPNETIRRYALGGLKNITGRDLDTVDEWHAWEKQQN